MVIPVVVGALGAIDDRLPGWLAQIPGTISVVGLQKSALLGTAQVLRRVLRLPGLWQSLESENNTTHGRVKKNFFLLLNLLTFFRYYYYYCYCYCYYFLRSFQSFGNNEKEVRCKITSEYRNGVRRVLKSKLSSKNKVTAIHTCVVPVIRYPVEVIS